MKEIVLGIWLIILGGIDFKRKEIPLGISLIGGVIGVAFCVMESRSPISTLISCMPGLLTLGFSRITREVIGYGDGIVFTIMGLYVSLSEVIEIGMMAFCIAGIGALILLVLAKKNGKYRIPFIPFLVIAYGIRFFVG